MDRYGLKVKFYGYMVLGLYILRNRDDGASAGRD
jgi:hypothetical protein